MNRELEAAHDELNRARVDFDRERKHLLDALTHANAQTAAARELASRYERNLMRLAAKLAVARRAVDSLAARLRSLAPLAPSAADANLAPAA